MCCLDLFCIHSINTYIEPHILMKDITDTVNNVHDTDCCYVIKWVSYNCIGSVPYGRLLFVWDITITSALCMSCTNQS